MTYRDRWGMERPYWFELTDSGWADMEKIYDLIYSKNGVVTKLHDDNWTDGYVHLNVTVGDDSYEVKANAWVAPSFVEFISWLSKK